MWVTVVTQIGTFNYETEVRSEVVDQQERRNKILKAGETSQSVTPLTFGHEDLSSHSQSPNGAKGTSIYNPRTSTAICREETREFPKAHRQPNLMFK